MNYKKNALKFTFGVLGIAALAITVYDILAMNQGGRDSSISAQIIEMSYKMPLVVFIMGDIFGLLKGHLFWRMRDTKTTKQISDMTDKLGKD